MYSSADPPSISVHATFSTSEEPFRRARSHEAPASPTYGSYIYDSSSGSRRERPIRDEYLDHEHCCCCRVRDSFKPPSCEDRRRRYHGREPQCRRPDTMSPRRSSGVDGRVALDVVDWTEPCGRPSHHYEHPSSCQPSRYWLDATIRSPAEDVLGCLITDSAHRVLVYWRSGECETLDSSISVEVLARDAANLEVIVRSCGYRRRWADANGQSRQRHFASYCCVQSACNQRRQSAIR